MLQSRTWSANYRVCERVGLAFMFEMPSISERTMMSIPELTASELLLLYLALRDRKL